MANDGAEFDREPPYWRDAACSFARTLAAFLTATTLAVILHGVSV